MVMVGLISCVNASDYTDNAALCSTTVKTRLHCLFSTAMEGTWRSTFSVSVLHHPGLNAARISQILSFPVYLWSKGTLPVHLALAGQDRTLSLSLVRMFAAAYCRTGGSV